MGVDVFVHWSGTDPNLLAQHLLPLQTDTLELTMITNRGIKVWPEGFEETFCTDHWRCRFKTKSNRTMNKNEIIQILQQAERAKIDTIKTENLYSFDGIPAFSLGQGQ